jgi:hypothetical protein
MSISLFTSDAVRRFSRVHVLKNFLRGRELRSRPRCPWRGSTRVETCRRPECVPVKVSMLLLLTIFRTPRSIRTSRQDCDQAPRERREVSLPRMARCSREPLPRRVRSGNRRYFSSFGGKEFRAVAPPPLTSETQAASRKRNGLPRKNEGTFFCTSIQRRASRAMPPEQPSRRET